MLLLTEHDVRTLLPTADLIDCMEQALVQFSSGDVQQPLRTVLEVGPDKAFFGVMPACIPGGPALGTKLVTVFARNRERGLPTHLATIVLLDPGTGTLEALMDGRYITEARTAAVSAVSVKLLARPDAGHLAILGTGVQARSHLVAIAEVRRLERVRVWSPRAASRDAFAREMQPAVRAPIAAAASPREALAGADIVVLVTASKEPVAMSEWIADGAHVCAVGACRPDQREMEGRLVGRARVFVDSRQGAMAEAGDIVLAAREGAFDPARLAGELGDALAQRVPGRQSPTEVTIFKSLGMAVEDIAAARLAAVRAAERGVGRTIEL